MAEPQWPMYAALLGASAYITAVQTGTYNPAGNSVADAVVFLVTAPAVAGLSVALGLLPNRVNSLVGVVVLTAALQWGDPNPFPAMITVGFWLVGLSVRSHRRLAAALRVRAYELESSRDAYAQEALRYEHTRIARDLHDIVAHSLSVIVIQASAGRRLPPEHPTAPDLLDTITELTDQVRTDLDGLTRLLDESRDLSSPVTRQSIEDLIARTAETGSPVTCHLPEDFDELPGRLAAVVYRIIQEGLTNAIKHAPGAPIDVRITTVPSVCVAVGNGATRTSDTTPAAPGAGRGIPGLSERVHAADGTFTSGPSPQGGWQLSADLPR
jgi:signal transduction histidine kinase